MQGPIGKQACAVQVKLALCKPLAEQRKHTLMSKTASKNADKPATASPGARADGDPVSRFEDDMQALETIVQKLERGELRLEESLELFQRGMALSQQCRSVLEHAELQVRTLLKSEMTNSADATAPSSSPTDDDSADTPTLL